MKEKTQSKVFIVLGFVVFWASSLYFAFFSSELKELIKFSGEIYNVINRLVLVISTIVVYTAEVLVSLLCIADLAREKISKIDQNFKIVFIALTLLQLIGNLAIYGLDYRMIIVTVINALSILMIALADRK